MSKRTSKIKKDAASLQPPTVDAIEESSNEPSTEANSPEEVLEAVEHVSSIYEGFEPAGTDDSLIVAPGDSETVTSPALTSITMRSNLSGDEFRLEKGKVLCLIKDNDGRKEFLPVCSEIRVMAYARDPENKTWCRLLEFEDQDGFSHKHLVKMEDLEGEGIFSTLRSMGVVIYPGRGRKEKLLIYLQDTEPQSTIRCRCVTKTGWHEQTFVLANGKSIGANEDHYIYLGGQAHSRAMNETGDLEGWKQNVARLCTGSSRLILALCTAFASPLVKLVGDESGGVNLFGSSSIGKTTALHVAASVFGDPGQVIMSWRATANGLEGAALRANDSLLILDEFGQIEPKEAGDTTYMLANGSGKTRANRSGDTRQASTWNLIYLSTGEVTLADHMSEGGRKAKAGQSIRLLDIPADPGAGHGIFGTLHEFDNGAEFSETLKSNAKRFHGSAIRAFLEDVNSRFDTLPGFIQRFREKFIAAVLPPEASGQVRRVANRFALFAAAGEYATLIGVTGWRATTDSEEGEAFAAVAECFRGWLRARGGDEMQEVTSLLAQVRQFFENHGESRFTLLSWDRDNPTIANNHVTMNRSGFRRLTTAGFEYLVLPETFKEICKGFNPTFAAKTLSQKGILVTDNQGKPQTNHRLPGMGVKKVYYFRPAVLADV